MCSLNLHEARDVSRDTSRDTSRDVSSNTSRDVSRDVLLDSTACVRYPSTKFVVGLTIDFVN